jgi:adenosylcobinamide-GDP ribazoletransferase
MPSLLREMRDDLALAVSFLTRVPLPAALAPRGAVTAVELARSQRVFPLVGAAIGLLAGAVLALALWLGLPAWPAAVLALAAQIGLTGGLHEDGLADVADGFGGRDRESKLAIMRDSRIGAYGMLALLVGVLLRASALAAIAAGGAGAGLAALAAAGALSRAGIPAVMRALKPARADGLAAAHGRPDARICGLAAAAALLIAVPALGIEGGLLAAAAAALATAGLARLALKQVGGYTGDVLGAAQQAAEIAILLALAAR